jgi:hypothetical protein
VPVTGRCAALLLAALAGPDMTAARPGAAAPAITSDAPLDVCVAMRDVAPAADDEAAAAIFEGHPPCRDARHHDLSPTSPPVELSTTWRPEDGPRTIRLHVHDVVGETARWLRYEIVVAPRDAGPPRLAGLRRISKDVPGNYRPRWSHDGAFVAFQQIGDAPRLMVWERQRDRLHEVPMDGGDGGARPGLYAVAGAEPVVTAFEWHPSEPEVLLKVRGRPIPQLARVHGGGIATSRLDALPMAETYAFSPDGAMVAYRRAGHEASLNLRHRQHRWDVPLCDDRLYCDDVRWSADSRAVVFWRAERARETGRTSEYQIVVARVDVTTGAFEERVVSATATPEEDGVARPSLTADWSPSGRQLAFATPDAIHLVEVSATARSAPPSRAVRVSADLNKSRFVWLDERYIAYVARDDTGRAPIAWVDVVDGQSGVLYGDTPQCFDLDADRARDRLAFSCYGGRQLVYAGEIVHRPGDAANATTPVVSGLGCARALQPGTPIVERGPSYRVALLARARSGAGEALDVQLSMSHLFADVDDPAGAKTQCLEENP